MSFQELASKVLYNNNKQNIFSIILTVRKVKLFHMSSCFFFFNFESLHDITNYSANEIKKKIFGRRTLKDFLFLNSTSYLLKV